MRARQLIVPGVGFVWAAVVGRFPLRVSGFDRFTGGEGEMHWKLAGLVPVMSSSGPDFDRSAAGRLAAEATLLAPSLLDDGITWTVLDAERAVARIPVAGWRHEVTVTVDQDGGLREVSLPRWGSPDGGPFREGVFRVRMEGERCDGRIVMPAAFEAGWDEDAQGAFMRCTVVDAVPQ